jgi:hypothetical protein
MATVTFLDIDLTARSTIAPSHGGRFPSQLRSRAAASASGQTHRDRQQGSGGALNSQPEANASVLLGTELHQHRDDQHPRLVVASDSAEISGSDVLPVLFFQGRAPRSATIMISRLDQIIA